MPPGPGRYREGKGTYEPTSVPSPLPWFEYGDARNLTSHTYNEDQAAAVYATVERFAVDAKTLLGRLEAAND